MKRSFVLRLCSIAVLVGALLALSACSIFGGSTTGTSGAPTAGILPLPGYFSSKDGKFQVKFGGEPIANVAATDSGFGSMVIHNFRFTPAPNRMYFVSYGDYPDTARIDQKADKILRASKDGVIGNFKVKQTSEKAFAVNDNRGIDYTASSDKYALRYKTLIVRNRLYQVGALHIGKTPVDVVDDAFIDSFALLNL